MYEQEINQHLWKPSYQKLKTMVKRQKDQKIRARNFEAGKERIATGVLLNKQWKAQGHCTIGDACCFRLNENKHGNAMQPSSLTPKPHTQSDGKILSKGKLSEAVVLLERDPEDRAKTTSVESARPRHVIFGILPYVNIAKHNRGANSVKNASLCTERFTVSIKKPQKVWWQRFCCHIEKFYAFRLCISGCRAAEIQFDFTEIHKIRGTETQREIIKRYSTSRKNSGKIGSIARCDTLF